LIEKKSNNLDLKYVMFKKKTMKREEITASSNAGHHINFSITDTDDTILI